MKDQPSTTHFGFQQVPVAEKQHKVAEVFHSVANQYDVMNDVMSLGLHRLWKKTTILLANVRPGQAVLDVAGGTGDLASQFALQVGSEGQVVLLDINGSMLNRGRERLLDAGIVANVSYVQADAEKLPIASASFHCITMAFGLRNVTDKLAALKEMYRVLKPGGQLLVLEFSKVTLPALQTVYDAYSFHLLPKLGEWIAKDKASYQYLVESIRMHPDQETLKMSFNEAGFDRVDYHNFTGGVVALHRGVKY